MGFRNRFYCSTSRQSHNLRNAALRNREFKAFASKTRLSVEVLESRLLFDGDPVLTPASGNDSTSFLAEHSDDHKSLTSLADQRQ